MYGFFATELPLEKVMGVKKHIFGSSAEKNHFEQLKRRWGDKYYIYHNLPFLMVFDTENLFDYSNRKAKPIRVTKQEVEYLKKTSIDYVFCNKSDQPLICIEFDGLYDGHNWGTKYVSNRPADNTRNWGMNIKLKVSHGSLFPYFVLSNDHMSDLSKELQVAIVDGIIGEIRASQVLSERAAKFEPSEIGETEESFNNLQPWERDELIQDWFLVTEVEVQMENNPISQMVGELEEVVKSVGHSVKWMNVPEKKLPRTKEEAIHYWEDIVRFGATVSVKTKTGQEFERTAWLPNFNTPLLGEGQILSLVEEIAHLMALDAAKKAMT